jgi:hypothetical protein
MNKNTVVTIVCLAISLLGFMSAVVIATNTDYIALVALNILNGLTFLGLAFIGDEQDDT